MDSLVVLALLAAIIVFVRYDLMLFAVLTGILTILLFFVEIFGKAGRAAKGTVGILKEGFKSDWDEIEAAPPGYPSKDFLKNIYDNFVSFLVKDNPVKKTTLEQIQSGSEKLLNPSKASDAHGGGHAGGHGHHKSGAHAAHTKGHGAWGHAGAHAKHNGGHNGHDAHGAAHNGHGGGHKKPDAHAKGHGH